MIRLPQIIISIFIFIVGVYSCQKDGVEINGWSPELISPIINATITMSDLIPERGTTEYDDNNLIHLAFRSDTIYVLPAELLLDITGLNIDTMVTIEQLVLSVQDDPTIGPIINSLLDTTFPEEGQEVVGALFGYLNEDIIEPFSFQFDEFSDAAFNSGNLEIEITNNLPVALENVEINISPELGVYWDVNIVDLSPGETAVHIIDLSNLTITNSSSIELDIETLTIENVGAQMVEVTPETGFEFSFSIIDVGFDNITLPLGGDTVDVDLALFEDFDSGLRLEHPRFTINIENPFGLSGNISGQLIAFSPNGVSENLSIEVDIDPNASSSATYEDDEIAGVIELPPAVIEYEAHASMSFSASDINGEDPLKLGVDIDFPLVVNAANLSLKDTVIFNGVNYDISKISRMLLHYNFINKFPLGTEFSLVLHDSLNPINNLDTLEFVGSSNSGNNIINPAIVNEYGNVIDSVISSGVLTMTDSEINNLLNTNKIIIDITLSSSDSQNQNQYVSIYSDSECLLKVGLETEVNLD
jgi:hypothetical protein